MGAWGAGTFENDAALDWMGDVRRGGVSVVREALLKAANADERLDDSRCCEALAAAEIVAAVLGSPPQPPEPSRDVVQKAPMLADWAAAATEDAAVVARRMPELVDDVALARRAIATVLDPARSERYLLWSDEDGPAPDWIEAVEDIRQRLDA
jgi:hypothetical protein